MQRRIGALAIVGVVAMASTARAEDRPSPRYQAVDVQALAVVGLLPHGHFGVDAAYTLGSENFQARFGGQVLGARPFTMAGGKIGNILADATIDTCGAKVVQRHRVRMCVGGQGGVMFHRWIDFKKPGRTSTPWVAGVLKGDYLWAARPHFGLLFGAAVILPLVGPEFRARDVNGQPAPIMFAGPVAGMLTLGASFRLG